MKSEPPITLVSPTKDGAPVYICCLTSPAQASVSQGRICSDSCTCCHTEIEAADQTCYHTQSQYSDTGPTSPSADPVMPGTWHSLKVTGVTQPGNRSTAKAGIKPRSGGRNSSLVVFGLAVHSVAGSILLLRNFPVEGIFPLELTWVQTLFPPKLFRMRV